MNENIKKYRKCPALNLQVLFLIQLKKLTDKNS